jgi:hypothetical protein
MKPIWDEKLRQNKDEKEGERTKGDKKPNRKRGKGNKKLKHKKRWKGAHKKKKLTKKTIKEEPKIKVQQKNHKDFLIYIAQFNQISRQHLEFIVSSWNWSSDVRIDSK